MALHERLDVPKPVILRTGTRDCYRRERVSGKGPGLDLGFALPGRRLYTPAHMHLMQWTAGLWLSVVAPENSESTETKPSTETKAAPATEASTPAAPSSTWQPSRLRSFISGIAGNRSGSGRKSLKPQAPPPQGRKFMVGLEGVLLSSPPIQSRVIQIDPRFVGRSVALGGGGLFGRYRPISLLGVELGVRSGSLRYKSRNNEDTVSTDQILADVAALIYLGRGEVAQFALSGGIGGMWNRVGYERGTGEDGVHTFGSVLFRVGGEAEFLVKRVAFVLSFRNYAQLTNPNWVSRRGGLLSANTVANTTAPVARFQTILVGSAGIAYRF